MDYFDAVALDDNKLRIKIENKLEEIYTVIFNFKPTNSFGLMGGYGGVILFLYHYYRYTKQDAHLLFLHKNFSFFYSEFSKITYGSYANGYSGICWLIRYLAKEQVLQSSNIDDVLSEIDNAILYLMAIDMRNNNYDFLHGCLGIAYYFATTANSNNIDYKINLFLKSLDNSKEVNSNGSIKWLNEVYVNNKNKGMVYNLSLSHGMAAIVAFLSKLIKNDSNKELALELLNKTIQFYKDSMNPISFISTFPSWFEQNSTFPSESPLSWCYGDPGIAQVLYNAGTLIEDKELISISLAALIKTTTRSDTETERIREACFCHGSSSLCHIYNRLYQKNHLKVFKDAALFWLNDTLEKGKNESPLAGYKFFENGDVMCGVNLLAGLSGVGLSLLAAIDTLEPKWDECMLLS